MNLSAKKTLILSLMFLFLPAVSLGSSDEIPGAVLVRGMQLPIKGHLRHVEGVPVLTVWGTPWEQGFAHGYIFCDRITGFFDEFLSKEIGMLSPKEYEEWHIKLSWLKMPSEHEAEMRGMLEGMEARAGGPVRINAVKRQMRYEDLVMANSMGDMSRLAMKCSSFAVWGSMTEDTCTLSARNYEWPEYEAMKGKGIVLVRLPPPGSGALGTVSVFYPGLLGVISAMNAEGVNVCTHDSSCSNPFSIPWGFTPITLLYREVLERARSAFAVEDITRVLAKNTTITGNNMMVSRPCAGWFAGGFVVEHDPCLDQDRGATVREPDEGKDYVICTNRFFTREVPSSVKLAPCERFEKLTRKLDEIANNPDLPRITLEKVWELAESVPIEGLVTYHRIVFEPDKKLMHVAFPADGEPVKRITLDVAKLLKRDEAGARKTAAGK